VALPFTLKKKYLKAKKEEELWKLKYFTQTQKYNLQKILLKKTQSPSRDCTSITNLKFQHKPNKFSSFKNPHIKNRPMT
jgi:hypothetical protein